VTKPALPMVVTNLRQVWILLRTNAGPCECPNKRPEWTSNSRASKATSYCPGHAVVHFRLPTLLGIQRCACFAVPPSRRACGFVALVEVAVDASGSEVVQMVGASLRARFGMIDVPSPASTVNTMVLSRQFLVAKVAIAA